MARFEIGDLKTKKLLLIVGEQKCGTTSLFDYLSAHPDIFGSNRKQTFYFMPESFQKLNKSEVPIEYSENPKQFLRLFPGYVGSEKFLLEATPDYLHTQQVLERINKFKGVFEKIIIIIILRDPIERFRSWFNFAKQQQTIDPSIKIEQFYEMNRPVEESYVSFNSCFFALYTGMYDLYIPDYTEAFGEDVKVYSFEKIKENPKQFMFNLANDIGADVSFYENYEFKRSNTTVSARFPLLRNLYMKFREYYLCFCSERFRYLLRPIARIISRGYHSLNDKELNNNVNSEKDQKILAELSVKYKNTYDFCKESLDIRWGDE